MEDPAHPTYTDSIIPVLRCGNRNATLIVALTLTLTLTAALLTLLNRIKPNCNRRAIERQKLTSI